MPFVQDGPAAKRLVLCFDGTGNTFSGSTADTNVVKLYDKLNRDTDDQYHYYQTGIGTYDIEGGSLNKGFFGNMRSSVSKSLDSGFGTSFDAHVIAGYRFVMRYYDKGDKIYMFGFSRGAYAARFLARMINTVGLLSKGNEEMVPFAYQLYQEYEQGQVKFDQQAAAASSSSSNSETAPLLPSDEDEAQFARNKLNAFTSTFCRREGQAPSSRQSKTCFTGIKVHFLGLWDCVNSVAVLETPFGKAPPLVSVTGTARHVRHAVATDERRVKFKAALLNQDTNDTDNAGEDRKEVWFPGNHGDVGGGWPAPKPGETRPQNFFQYLAMSTSNAFAATKAALTTRWNERHKNDTNKPPVDPSADSYQMSDIALAWMINELEAVEAKDSNKLQWSDRKDAFLRNLQKKSHQALTAEMHDTMSFGWGSGFTKVLMWKFMEWVPLIPRYEMWFNKKTGKDEWYYKRFGSNLGATRDMPKNAVLHESLLWRLANRPGYAPKNDHGDGTKPCLINKAKKETENFGEHFETCQTQSEAKSLPVRHHTYHFKNQKPACDVCKKIA